MRKNKICLPELPLVSYNVTYVSACGSAEKRTVQGPMEGIKALESV